MVLEIQGKNYHNIPEQEDSIQINSIRRFLKKNIKEAGRVIEKKGPFELAKKGTQIVQEKGTKNIFRAVLNWFRRKINHYDLEDLLEKDICWERTQPNITSYVDYLKRTGAIYFSGPELGKMEYPNGKRLADDYEHYQSVFWAHGWR